MSALITPTKVQFNSRPVKKETPSKRAFTSIFCADTAPIAWENSVAEIRSRVLG